MSTISTESQEEIHIAGFQSDSSAKDHRYMYSIICLFRYAVEPEEKFGLDRVRITGSLCLVSEIKMRSELANFSDLGT